MFSTNSQTPHNRETNKKLVKIIHSLLNADESVPFRKPVPHKGKKYMNFKLWGWETTKMWLKNQLI
jgi:hypothetical protein